MYKLPASLHAWNTPGFAAILKNELKNLPVEIWPLQACTRFGGMVDTSELGFTLLRQQQDDKKVILKLGVFFGERVGGCSCHDDPVLENGYCEMMLSIDRLTAQLDISVLAA